MAGCPAKSQLYKGRLHEYCQKNNLLLEYKDVKVEGPAHDRVFTVMVIISQTEYPHATGKNKKEAKEEAAKAAWDTIAPKDQTEQASRPSTPEPQPSPPPPPLPLASPSDLAEEIKPLDYISKLAIYGVKNNIIIDYSLKESGPPHKRIFSYVCKIGDNIYGEGTGNDKKAAKQAASKSAYEQLISQDISREGAHAAVASSANNVLSESSEMSVGSSANSTDSESKYMNSNGSLVNKMNDMKVGEDSSSSRATPKNSAVKPKRREMSAKLAPKFSGQQVKEEREENIYTEDERFRNDFEVIEVIGSGGFGTVFKVKQIIDKKNYAVKRVKYTTKVQREVEALAKLEHENIIRYYTCWIGEDYTCSENSSSLSSQRPVSRCLFIQMEFCEKGTLEDWIDEKRGMKNYQAESLIKFRQIVTGVEYIHSKEFIHRDLKPLNIFISSEDKIKIGDFGLVTSMTDDQRTTEKGTRSYMSPEQHGDKYGPEVDIFALGLILFEILWIFSTVFEKNEQWRKIRDCILPKEFSDRFPAEKHVIEQLLAKDVAKRPSASDVLKLLELVDRKNPDSARTC